VLRGPPLPRSSSFFARTSAESPRPMCHDRNTHLHVCGRDRGGGAQPALKLRYITSFRLYCRWRGMRRRSRVRRVEGGFRSLPNAHLLTCALQRLLPNLSLRTAEPNLKNSMSSFRVARHVLWPSAGAMYHLRHGSKAIRLRRYGRAELTVHVWTRTYSRQYPYAGTCTRERLCGPLQQLRKHRYLLSRKRRPRRAGPCQEPTTEVHHATSFSGGTAVTSPAPAVLAPQPHRVE